MSKKNLAKLLPKLTNEEMAWLQVFAPTKRRRGVGNFPKCLANLDVGFIMFSDAIATYKHLHEHWLFFEHAWPELVKKGRDHAIAITSLEPKLREYVKEHAGADTKTE